jgi:hypothetical protein
MACEKSMIDLFWGLLHLRPLALHRRDDPTEGFRPFCRGFQPSGRNRQARRPRDGADADGCVTPACRAPGNRAPGAFLLAKRGCRN